MITLQGSTFCLRSWQPGDEAALVKYGNNLNVSRYLADRFPYPYTLADAENWIAFVSKQNPVLTFAIDVDGEAAGGIGLEPRPDERRKTVHIGYWLAEPFWGRQIVSEATKLVVEYGFATLDIVRIESVVYHPNTASMRVLEKAGFVKEGVSRKAIFKNGEFYDEHIYGLVAP